MKLISQNILLNITYLIWCIGLSSFTLNAFTQMIPNYLAVHYDYKLEMIMVTGQVGFQWLFMQDSSWLQRYRYMFIALTVSMTGALMLIPLLIYNWMVPISPITALIYFFCVVFAIFIIHHTLIKKESLPPRLTLTWVLYRCLLLAFVTFPR